MRAWRDLSDLAVGAHTERTLLRAVGEDSDACLLVVTPSFLAAPPGWVALMGHLLASVGRLTVHQYRPETDSYEEA